MRVLLDCSKIETSERIWNARDGLTQPDVRPFAENEKGSKLRKTNFKQTGQERNLTEMIL